MGEPERCIAHLDMDAFFASVELLKYPELRGRPVVVGGGKLQQPVMLPDGNRKFSRISEYAGRGVVTTSTYEARAFGIFSAMGIMKAARLAPDSILLPADFESYRHYSAKFKEAVARIVPVIENVGIDEIYIDWSASGRDPRLLASEIKQAVFSATGLSCPIGLAPNKLLAPPRVESQTVFAVEMSISCHMQLADVRVSSKSFRGRYLRRVDLQLFHSEIAF